jgi:hypothetical protein
MMMKHKKIMYLVLITVLAVALCGAFPTEVFAAKALKGTLAGAVLDQNGKPVSNTQVYVFQRDWTNTDGMGIPDWKSLAGTATTARNGQYKISLPAGEYKVWFVPQNLDAYAMEAYPDAPVIRLGDTVTVRYGKTTGGVSAILDASGKIRGRILDTKPGFENLGLADVPIALCLQDYSIKTSLLLTSTDEDGYYEFSGLKAYPWELWVNTFIFGVPGQTEPDDVLNYKPDYKDFFISAMGQYNWQPGAGQTATPENILLEYKDFVNITGNLVYYDETAQDYLPADGVTVRADFADDPNNINGWGGDYLEATTDENGVFEIKGFTQSYGVFILWTDGNVNGYQIYYNEYKDNSDQWGAEQYQLCTGYCTYTGQWEIGKIPDGENP